MGPIYADTDAIVDKLVEYEEPDLLLDEFKVVIKNLRGGKATGINQILADVLKALDDRGLKILHSKDLEDGALARRLVHIGLVTTPQKRI